jgi:hypothetical protein
MSFVGSCSKLCVFVGSEVACVLALLSYGFVITGFVQFSIN